MKTFTAHEFHQSPAQVYRAADKEGEVKINHDRYDDKIFFLVSRDRNSDYLLKPYLIPEQVKDLGSSVDTTLCFVTDKAEETRENPADIEVGDTVYFDGKTFKATAKHCYSPEED